MRRTVTTPIILILSLILTAVGFSSCNKGNERRVGGPCHYKNEPVTITITKIKTTSEQDNNSSNEDTEDVIIEYELFFDDGIRKGQVIRQSLGVTKQKIIAKGIKVGKKYRASISYQVSGTCHPGPIYPGLEEWR